MLGSPVAPFIWQPGKLKSGMWTAGPSSPASQSLASGAAVAQPSQKPREGTE